MKSSIIGLCMTALPIAAIFSCCGEKTDSVRNYNGVISISASDNEHPAPGSAIVDSVSFINLHYSLAGVEKVIFDGEGIYLLSDRYGIPKVVKFDFNGIPIAKYGAFGHGKNEYTRISDFDVHHDTVYLHDGHSHKMLLYDSSGNFMASHGTNAHAQAFIIASTDTVVFMPLKYKADEELAYADFTLSDYKPMLYKKPNAKDTYASFNYFTRCQDGKILYYHSPYDEIHLIDDGRISDSYKIDFGDKNLPEEAVDDFGEALDKNIADEYCYVDDCPVMAGRYIIGRFSNRGAPATFVYDTATSKTAFKEYRQSGMTITDIVNPVTVYGNKVIGVIDASYMEYLERPELLPESTKEHLQNGGFSLALYSICAV